MGKIVSQRQLAKIRNHCRLSSQTVVFTNGCFDIIHRGHVEYLSKAKSLGDILIVAINSDKSVRRLKGKGRPVINEKDRAFILSHLDMVDYVTLFDSLTPLSLIRKISPDVLVKGGDYDADSIVGAADVKASGGKVKVMPYLRGYSSSAVIGKLKKGKRK